MKFIKKMQQLLDRCDGHVRFVKEWGQSVEVILAAYSPEFRLFVFQISGLYL